MERADGGYRALGPSPALDAPTAEELRSVARVQLPPSVVTTSLLGRMTGRWFGSLRWVGTIERPTGRLLAWARRDGSGMALLGVRGGYLQVYVPGGSTSDDPTESEEAAYELLFHAVEAARPPAEAEAAAEARARAFVLARPTWAIDN